MSNEQLTLRKAKSDEIFELCELGKETFYDTYAHLNDPENFEDYTRKAFSSAQWQKEFTNPLSEFYVVTQGEEMAGYMKLNFGKAQTESDQPNSCEIERIYVREGFKGKGIGRMMIQKAVIQAQDKIVDYIWLGVWEENPEAIAFYEAVGFYRFGTHIFQIGEEAQTDILMRIDL